jgi:PTH2 family peptidyl-tRNA hydrolase
MYKQLIIVRKDLNMSIGKCSAQISHASMAFLTRMIQEHTGKCIENRYPAWENPPKNTKPQLYKRMDLYNWAEEARNKGQTYFYARPVDPADPNGQLELCEPTYHYETHMELDTKLYEEWLGGIFTKVVCEAKNKNQLLKAVRLAEELGLVEDKDFFIIRDCCLTELTPEEFDENGIGRTITCIGFRPMEQEIMEKISKKFQLMK